VNIEPGVTNALIREKNYLQAGWERGGGGGEKTNHDFKE